MSSNIAYTNLPMEIKENLSVSSDFMVMFNKFNNFQWCLLHHPRKVEAIWQDQKMKQRDGLGMERTKRDEIIALFNWDEEEENELKKLSWKSSWPDNLQNRKYRHLTYLFEAIYAVSITPSLNLTQNPTSEWELRYYG